MEDREEIIKRVITTLLERIEELRKELHIEVELNRLIPLYNNYEKMQKLRKTIETYEEVINILCS